MLRFEGTKAVQKVQNLDLLIKTLVAFEKLIHYNNCRIFFQSSCRFRVASVISRYLVL